MLHVKGPLWFLQSDIQKLQKFYALSSWLYGFSIFKVNIEGIKKIVEVRLTYIMPLNHCATKACHIRKEMNPAIA